MNDAQTKINYLNEIMSKPKITDQDIAKMESEINASNQTINELMEQKMKTSSNGDANLTLFRQQAAIIARKKEGTLAKIPAIQEELHKLQELANSAEQKKPSAPTKMLEGEEFKRYVSELRGKSTNFKRKKGELSSISAEYGTLQRTEQVCNYDCRF